MGQAKRRGNYEDRKKEAIERKEKEEMEQIALREKDREERIKRMMKYESERNGIELVKRNRTLRTGLIMGTLMSLGRTF